MCLCACVYALQKNRFKLSGVKNKIAVEYVIRQVSPHVSRNSRNNIL